MISRIQAVLLTLLVTFTSAKDKVVLLSPSSSDEGTPIAVVWIVGEDYTAQAYQTIAQAFQQEASAQGLKAWVAIPDFTYSSVKHTSIDSKVKDSMKALATSGFAGDNLFLAAHSLGGVMAQDYLTEKKPDYSFKGQILMGSVLGRSYRSIQDDGTTVLDFPTDTLTIGGTKDGLLRITRVAEAYWHSTKNINAGQAGSFPVVALEGVSHALFSSGAAPKSVVKGDLNAEVTETDAHSEISKYMAYFAKQLISGETFSTGATDAILAPLIAAIELEGSYIMKDACYTSDDVNPPSNTCLHGSPWMSNVAVKTLVGEFENSEISLEADDNFHRSSTVYPYHHPHISDDCIGATGACTVKSLSNSMLINDSLNESKNERTMIAATEIRAKIKSVQAYRVAAGEDVSSDDDYTRLDLQQNECQRVNQAALDWAMENAGEVAKKNFELRGEPLVMQTDKNTGNGGLWIDESIKVKESKDHSEMYVIALGCPTTLDNPVAIFRGMHYCKLLSPFRAMEWIYVDGLYSNDSLARNEAQQMFLQ